MSIRSGGQGGFGWLGVAAQHARESERCPLRVSWPEETAAIKHFEAMAGRHETEPRRIVDEVAG
jgi:hypothetical protein